MVSVSDIKGLKLVDDSVKDLSITLPKNADRQFAVEDVNLEFAKEKSFVLLVKVDLVNR